MRRHVTILGATGSVGRSAREVIAENPERLAVAGVVSGRDVAGLARVARESGARFAAIADESRAGELRDALAGSGIRHGAGRSAVLDAVALDPTLVSDTLGALLKYQDDIQAMQGSKVRELLDQVKAEARA